MHVLILSVPLSSILSHTHSHKGRLIFLSQASGSLDIPRSISLKTDTHPISLVQKCHAIPVDIIQKLSQGPCHCGTISCAWTVLFGRLISNDKCPLALAFFAALENCSKACRLYPPVRWVSAVNNEQKGFDSIIGSPMLEPEPLDLTSPNPPRSKPTSLYYPLGPRGPLSGPLPLCITSIRLGC